MAASKFPWLPVRLLMRDRFRADLAAGEVHVPVFQVHCVSDPVIPLTFGRRLHQLFPVHGDLVEVPGKCHPVSASGFEAVLTQFKVGMTRSD